MIKLIITDLDNTLYDWVGFFSQSFEAMLAEICSITEIDRNTLISDFKKIHQKYHNSERPYAALELPSIIEHYKTNDKLTIYNNLEPAFSKFKMKAASTLKLYPNVLETLKYFHSRGITIVGHTESFDVNSSGRIKALSIRDYFKHLYTLKSDSSSHPDIKRPILMPDDLNWVVQLPREERKPNPKLLLDICSKEGVKPNEALYVGDSVPKDISMANKAGLVSVWAKYGREFQNANWKLLVEITHWTDEDVKQEENLKIAFGNEKPIHSISDYSQLIQIVSSYQ